MAEPTTSSENISANPIISSVSPANTDNSFKTKIKRVFTGLASLPPRKKSFLSIGMVLLLAVAIPVTVATIISSRTSFFNRAATGEPPPPTPICKSGVNSWVAGVTCKLTTGQVGYMSAQYQCYDSQTWYTATLNRCATSTELSAISQKFCANRFSCPTGSPVPTSSPICKANSFSVDTPCENSGYRYMSYVCSDGFRGRDGGPTSCKSYATWSTYARQYCLNHSNCQTPAPSTPTPPTLTPTPTPYADCYTCNKLNQCVFDAGCRIAGPRCSGIGTCPTGATTGPRPTTSPVPTPSLPPTSTPIASARPPIPTSIAIGFGISTASLPTARIGTPYYAVVTGYETNSPRTPTLKISITGLPRNLFMGTCSQSLTGKTSATISCTIQGRPAYWGVAFVRIYLSDNYGRTATRNLLLFTVPNFRFGPFR